MIGGPDLAQRTISALIMVPVVLGITFLGGLPFVLLWLVAAAGVLFEWSRVAQLSQSRAYVVVGLGGIAAAALSMSHGAVGYAALVLLATMAVCAFIGGRLGAGASGVFIAAMASLPIILLREEDKIGLSAALFIYAIVWCTDIGAYFVGRAFGGPKLWPRLSPNKTWSGAIGGAVIGTLAGCVLLLASGLAVAPIIVLVGLILSIVAQCGDLAESAYKRSCGVKDAGNIIPGHGGLLDRLDGFMAAALLALMIGLARGFDAPAAGLLLW